MSRRPVLILRLYLLLLVALPVTLLVLPADFFDEGRSLCLSQLLLDMPCYGCGMTRAVQHLLHLELEEAAQFNKLSFLVLPLLGYLWFGQVRGVVNTLTSQGQVKC